MARLAAVCLGFFWCQVFPGASDSKATASNLAKVLASLTSMGTVLICFHPSRGLQASVLSLCSESLIGFDLGSARVS